MAWTRVCRVHDVLPDRGVAALVGGVQVAVFRLSPDDEVLAISNFDPFSEAHVLSRGIVGSRGDVVTVASPVYKQRFDLRTGACLDDERVVLPTYDVRIDDGWLEVAGP